MQSKYSASASLGIKRKRRMGYRAAIQWLALNEDSSWATDDKSPQSVTAAFVADCFDVADAKVRTDLRHAVLRNCTQEQFWRC